MTIVAYQGEPGAYGEEAVLGWFGDAVTPVPMPTFSAVCAAIESGAAGAGVLPLENSVAGTVGDALDALAKGSQRVVGFLSAHAWEAVPAADTAGAARELAASGDSAGAAIASRMAAERYGLQIAASDIQDAPDNVTRFAVLVADHQEPPTPAGPLAPIGGDRETLLTFETGHRPGDLYRALGAFADAGINLSRIESRPSGEGAWRYRFLVQVSGDADDEPLRGALMGMRRHTTSVRVLGSFETGSGDH
jgi:prephenate dehydratase